MLSARDLDAMRATVDGSLEDHCVILSGAKTSDGAGGWVAAAAGDVPVACRVSPLATTGRDFEDVDGERLAGSVPWIVTMPAGTAVVQEARITHQESGITYEVVGPFVGRSYELDVRVIVRRVT